MSSILRTKKIALVDCNSFYVSCERLFNPKIRRKPVVVLSNNDGCIISRSNEAKAFASLDLDIIQPSLLDKTTTGFLLILGLNNLSQET
jgi:hypothetical protein